MANTFVFMGLPGAGKGKQSEFLSKKTGYGYYSSGDEFRRMSRGGDFIGKRIAEVMNAGGLMPSWLASFLFQKALIALRPEEGIIFEGVGRREPEARLFQEMCDWLGRDYLVLNLVVSEDTARARLLKRREIEGRDDDHPEVLSERFKNYRENTAPALEFFRSTGKVVDIDGEPTPEVVFAEISKRLGIS